MPNKVIYERFLWFHDQVRNQVYPNAGVLAQRFEVSTKTAQRDIDFMRDRLFAPLEYAAAQRGYRYSEDGFELPSLWLSEAELTALLLAGSFISAVPDNELKAELHNLLDHILEIYSSSDKLNLKQLNSRISLKNIGYYNTAGRTFHLVLDALLKRTSLQIIYYSPHKNETTERTILPLHLLCYMGSWHLIAHCSLRGELRDFTLARIRQASTSANGFDCNANADAIKAFIRDNFGIFAGENRQDVCIRFTPEVAGWVCEQIWHPDQQIEYEPDGHLRLAFPVADFTEIRREVLKFGAAAEVLAPETFRKQVQTEIKKMQKIYS